LSEHAWLPMAEVRSHLGLAVDDPDPDGLELARKAAAAYVERVRPDRFGVVDGEDVATIDDAILAGAVILTARLFARRQSPAGIASYGEFGPAQVLRLDPDVERLIGVGRYARPTFG
jgi:hypothetical protein